MSTPVAFVAALALSIAGLCYLLLIDEKRRRVFRVKQALALPRSKLAGWAMVVLPGIALVGVGQISAFLAWFGAVTVSAWLLASARPAAHRDD